MSTRRFSVLSPNPSKGRLATSGLKEPFAITNRFNPSKGRLATPIALLVACIRNVSIPLKED